MSVTWKKYKESCDRIDHLKDLQELEELDAIDKLEKMNMPKTKKQLCAYISRVLTDLLEEAQGETSSYADCSFHIDGNHTMIDDYISMVCTTYNGRNVVWNCSYNCNGSNDYTLIVFQLKSIKCFSGFVDDDETSLLAE